MTLTTLLPADEREVLDDLPCLCLALAHNEALRIQDFLRHHRSLGIRCFLIVDDHSDDGTFEYLREQPDVVLFRPNGTNYRQHKTLWRQELADTYGNGRWILFPDIDEHFVYPACEERKIDRLAAYLDGNGHEAVFAPMVEMYADAPPAEVRYSAGEPLLEHFPLFDGAGYRLVPPSRKHLRHYPTPPLDLLGGPRERIYLAARLRRPNAVQRYLLRSLYGLDQSWPPSRPRQRLQRLLAPLVRPLFPRPPLVMSKLALVKWRKGLRLPGGPHSVSARLALADIWGALLHFKYVNLEEEAAYNVRRGMHAKGAHHYRAMMVEAEKFRLSPVCEHTRRYRSSADLIDAGLLRSSAAWDAF